MRASTAQRSKTRSSTPVRARLRVSTRHVRYACARVRVSGLECGVCCGADDRRRGATRHVHGRARGEYSLMHVHAPKTHTYLIKPERALRFLVDLASNRVLHVNCALRARGCLGCVRRWDLRRRRTPLRGTNLQSYTATTRRWNYELAQATRVNGTQTRHNLSII